MKNLIIRVSILVLLVGLTVSCRKTLDSLFRTSTTTTTIVYPPITIASTYSTLPDFKQGIAKVSSALQAKNVYAYLDTLPNGYPNPNGRKTPLSTFGYSVLEKLGGNSQQVYSGVNDVFHFDGSTFSLISYIMKAEMVGQISPDTANAIISYIPLPPIPMDGFDPPMEPVIPDTPVYNCCDNCHPALDILTTSTYVAPCGNYSTTVSGKVVRDKLTNISKGARYRFDGLLTGCDCPGGVWNNSIELPGGHGTIYSNTSGIGVITFLSGTYTVTLSYSVCNKTVTKTLTLDVN
jgi:hypothetical protein